MLKLILALFLALPITGFAAVNHEGVYAHCVQWTTEFGQSTSKKFELTFVENEPLKLSISLYRGSASCQSDVVENLVSYEMEIVKDVGKDIGTVRIVTAKEVGGDLYFEIFFSPTGAMLRSGREIPVPYDMTKVVLLEKQQ